MIPKRSFEKKICFSASKLIKAYMSFFAYICHLTIFAYILALIIHFEAYFRFNWTYICTFPGWVGVWDGWGWVGWVCGWLVGWLVRRNWHNDQPKGSLDLTSRIGKNWENN